MDSMILVDIHDFLHLLSAFELMSPLSVSTNYIAMDHKTMEYPLIGSDTCGKSRRPSAATSGCTGINIALNIPSQAGVLLAYLG